ncbi:nitrile hydratase subunit alpha, partial [Klebsiella pneumoniae]|nr:nitrile hydratase subunit alpha [Klebsiella pneumoniae]
MHTARSQESGMSHDHADHEHDHHDHQHDHHHGSALSPVEARVRALESLLTEKGYVDPAALDALVELYETKVGPHAGAR